MPLSSTLIITFVSIFCGIVLISLAGYLYYTIPPANPPAATKNATCTNRLFRYLKNSGRLINRWCIGRKGRPRRSQPLGPILSYTGYGRIPSIATEDLVELTFVPTYLNSSRVSLTPVEPPPLPPTPLVVAPATMPTKPAPTRQVYTVPLPASHASSFNPYSFYQPHWTPRSTRPPETSPPLRQSYPVSTFEHSEASFESPMLYKHYPNTTKVPTPTHQVYSPSPSGVSFSSGRPQYSSIFTKYQQPVKIPSQSSYGHDPHSHPPSLTSIRQPSKTAVAQPHFEHPRSQPSLSEGFIVADKPSSWTAAGRYSYDYSSPDASSTVGGARSALSTASAPAAPSLIPPVVRNPSPSLFVPPTDIYSPSESLSVPLTSSTPAKYLSAHPHPNHSTSLTPSTASSTVPFRIQSHNTNTHSIAASSASKLNSRSYHASVSSCPPTREPSKNKWHRPVSPLLEPVGKWYDEESQALPTPTTATADYGRGGYMPLQRNYSCENEAGMRGMKRYDALPQKEAEYGRLRRDGYERVKEVDAMRYLAEDSDQDDAATVDLSLLGGDVGWSGSPRGLGW